MIHWVTDQLTAKFNHLSFIDKLGGVVYPLQVKKTNKDNATVLKTYPIVGNRASTCDSSDYRDMTPDDRYMSVIYFEAEPEEITEQRGLQLTAECNIRLVAWFNTQAINKAITSTDLSAEGMLRNIIALIQGRHTLGDVHVVVTPERIRFRDPSIFSHWSYDEAERQYLIYPFDFGAVEFNVMMIYNLCDEEIEIDPDCLNT